MGNFFRLGKGRHGHRVSISSGVCFRLSLILDLKKLKQGSRTVAGEGGLLPPMPCFSYGKVYASLFTVRQHSKGDLRAIRDSRRGWSSGGTSLYNQPLALSEHRQWFDGTQTFTIALLPDREKDTYTCPWLKQGIGG